MRQGHCCWAILLIVAFPQSGLAQSPAPTPGQSCNIIVVPTVDVARSIYLAVLAGMNRNVQSGDEVRVEDSGDVWEAFTFPKEETLKAKQREVDVQNER